MLSYSAGIVVRMPERPVYTDANPPRTCVNGHRLGPNRVLLGFVLCGCDRIAPERRGVGAGHRAWCCRVCGHVTLADGHVDDAALDGPLPVLLEPSRIPDEG